MATARVKQLWAVEKDRFKEVQKRNLRIFRQQPWREISGSFGDIGTFIPIFIALVGDRYGEDYGKISASSTLVFSGLFNLLTGIYFGIPLPVQPMKAIAAVAIASPGDYNQARYASAGLFVAAVVGFLSLTGLVRWFTKRVPVPIVKGIQVGAGLSLMASGFGKLPLRTSGWGWNMGYNGEAAMYAACTLFFLLFCSTRPRLPFVLIVVSITILVGIIGVTVNAAQGHSWGPHFSIWHPRPFVPGTKDFAFGAFNAGLGQIPLTTLNSIVAVVYLAEDLLPEAPAPSATAVGSSVATMNLLGCWFRAMPVCHGSGGLAAQYRFGARSGASVIFLGLLKIILGLFASQFVVEWCHGFPGAILAVLLLLAGIELVKMGENLNGKGARDLWRVDDPNSQSSSKYFTHPDRTERMRRYLVMTSTIGAIIGTHNDGVGFIVGLIVHFAFRYQDWEEGRRARREGQIRLGADRSPGADDRPEA
ncbi:MAG: hypothetical protein MMC23_003021 [Stictis urceolatum]|nr:hypothetical protein [Stictis urceolata]